MVCPKVMESSCLIAEIEIAAGSKQLKIGKAAGPTAVVSQMMRHFVLWWVQGGCQM